MNDIIKEIVNALTGIYIKNKLSPNDAISATANAFSDIIHSVAIATGYADNDEKAKEFVLEAFKQIVAQLENKK